jgi:small nuclear ribonucleoprotein D2
MTVEEIEKREQEEFNTGPMQVLTKSIKEHTQVLIMCRNNRKLLCYVKVRASLSLSFVDGRSGRFS